MRALQRADQLLGLVCCALLQPLRWIRPLRRPPAAVERVLAIKFWGIGSLQLLTPAAVALRRRHPQAELVLLTLGANRDFARRLEGFDRVVSLDVEGAGWLRVFGRIAALVAGLRAQGFDEVYDFEFFTRFSAVVAVLTGAPRIHGFAAHRVWRGRLHTEVVPFNRYWHVARNFRVLAGGEDGRAVAAGDVVAPAHGRGDLARLERIAAGVDLDLERPYAVLNPNAGSLSLERRWPPARFAELARRLAAEQGLAVALIGSAAESEYTARIADLAGRGSLRPVSLAGELDVGGLTALLATATVVISNDSGPMHLAAALGAPTVGLFGPETPVMYAPVGERARALYRPPACSPCINVHENKRSSCIWGEPQCLTAIEVDEVLAAVRGLLRAAPLELVPQGPQALPQRSA